MRRPERLVLPVLLAGLVAGIVWLRLHRDTVSIQTVRAGASARCVAAARDFRERRVGAWVTVAADVERILPDELGRYRHQRFIVRCKSGQTLLIVNDVSIGARVPVTLGKQVVVRGEYVWNALGGLIHFTHHDPEGGEGGWIFYRGKIYALGPVVSPVDAWAGPPSVAPGGG